MADTTEAPEAPEVSAVVERELAASRRLQLVTAIRDKHLALDGTVPDDIVAEIKAAEAELAQVENEVDRVAEKVREERR
jgi:hypothetical protein